MAYVRPFKGYCYNQQEIRSFGRVVAPPYDVISTEERAKYYEEKYNILHLTLPQKANGQDKYAHSASLLKQWINKEILVKDEAPFFLLYNHSFSFNNELSLRRGFLAVVKLEDFKDKIILPHEDTLTLPKKDRFELLKTTRTNLSPIFLIYPDKKNEIMQLLDERRELSVFANFTTPNGEKHTLWKVYDQKAHAELKEIFNKKKLYIADGHHRYETALKFYKKTKKESHRWLLVYLSPMQEDNLKIFSAHRLIKGFNADDWERLNKKAGDFFWLKELPTNDIKESFEIIKSEGNKRHAFGVLFNDSGTMKTLLLVSKNEKHLLEKMDGHSPAWKHLDVSVLHSLVFSHILGFEEEKLQETNRLSYEVHRHKTIDMVKEGIFQAAFLLNPTRVEEVKLVAERGEKMPGKATYFYPKVPSGLVIHKLEE